jgi:hypothetical protein
MNICTYYRGGSTCNPFSEEKKWFGKKLRLPVALKHPFCHGSGGNKHAERKDSEMGGGGGDVNISAYVGLGDGSEDHSGNRLEDGPDRRLDQLQ